MPILWLGDTRRGPSDRSGSERIAYGNASDTGETSWGLSLESGAGMLFESRFTHLLSVFHGSVNGRGVVDPAHRDLHYDGRSRFQKVVTSNAHSGLLDFGRPPTRGLPVCNTRSL